MSNQIGSAIQTTAKVTAPALVIVTNFFGVAATAAALPYLTGLAAIAGATYVVSKAIDASKNK